MIKISVKDNGIGIQPNDISKLFKLFGFIDSTKEMNTKGIGLGLYICKKIINIFGGDVSVDSEYKKGSQFTFNFMLSESSINDSTTLRILNPR